MAKKITLWSATILWMTMIFVFSSQPAVQSDELSLGIVERIFGFLYNLRDVPVFSLISDELWFDLYSKANFIVRKSAHFMLFAVLAFLVYHLLLEYKTNKTKAILVAAIICFLYALSDEVHQIFIPGRAGQIRDVFIDFSGSVSLLVIEFLISLIKKRKKNMRRV